MMIKNLKLLYFMRGNYCMLILLHTKVIFPSKMVIVSCKTIYSPFVQATIFVKLL